MTCQLVDAKGSYLTKMSQIDKQLLPWQVLENRDVYVAEPWMTVSIQRVKLPNGTEIEDYHKINLGEFSVIFAETPDGKVLVERQYKHGLGRVTLTLPAGAIHKFETPLEGAKRELLEETGYKSDNWKSLGSYVAHGSYECGKAHLFKASQVYQVSEPNSGDLEDMEILQMTPDEVVRTISQGDVELLGTMSTILLATHPLLQQGSTE